MARTAITLAKTHKGDWTLLASPDANLIEQRKNFRALRADKAHKDYATVIYQESDGPAEILRLITPAQKKKQEEQAAADRKAAAEFDAKINEQTKSDAPAPEPNPAE